MSGSAAAADERLEKLFDALFDSVLEVSPQLAVTLGRYFAQPGMIGGGEIGYYGWRAARTQACGNAGPKYDLASFHDQSLRFGSLPQALSWSALFTKSGTARG
jgi:uncharacterized protein (DUF885 family)